MPAKYLEWLPGDHKRHQSPNDDMKFFGIKLFQKLALRRTSTRSNTSQALNVPPPTSRSACGGFLVAQPPPPSPALSEHASQALGLEIDCSEVSQASTPTSQPRMWRSPIQPEIISITATPLTDASNPRSCSESPLRHGSVGTSQTPNHSCHCCEILKKIKQLHFPETITPFLLTQREGIDSEDTPRAVPSGPLPADADRFVNDAVSECGYEGDGESSRLISSLSSVTSLYPDDGASEISVGEPFMGRRVVRKEEYSDFQRPPSPGELPLPSFDQGFEKFGKSSIPFPTSTYITPSPRRSLYQDPVGYTSWPPRALSSSELPPPTFDGASNPWSPTLLAPQRVGYTAWPPSPSQLPPPGFNVGNRDAFAVTIALTEYSASPACQQDLAAAPNYPSRDQSTAGDLPVTPVAAWRRLPPTPETSKKMSNFPDIKHVPLQFDRGLVEPLYLPGLLHPPIGTRLQERREPKFPPGLPHPYPTPPIADSFPTAFDPVLLPSIVRPPQAPVGTKPLGLLPTRYATPPPLVEPMPVRLKNVEGMQSIIDWDFEKDGMRGWGERRVRMHRGASIC